MAREELSGFDDVEVASSALASKARYYWRVSVEMHKEDKVILARTFRCETSRTIDLRTLADKKMLLGIVGRRLYVSLELVTRR